MEGVGQDALVFAANSERRCEDARFVTPSSVLKVQDVVFKLCSQVCSLAIRQSHARIKSQENEVPQPPSVERTASGEASHIG